jgi:hypothetical protein
MSSKWLLLIIIGIALIGIVSAETIDGPPPDAVRPVRIDIAPVVTAVPVLIEEGIPAEIEQKEVTYTNYGDIVNTIIEKIKEIITPDKENTEKLDALVEATPPEVLNTPQTVVAIDGENVALIPQDSKFVGMKISTPCLRFGYGTNEWYNCEVYYANR